jgi:hypothetical protein
VPNLVHLSQFTPDEGGNPGAPGHWGQEESTISIANMVLVAPARSAPPSSFSLSPYFRFTGLPATTSGGRQALQLGLWGGHVSMPIPEHSFHGPSFYIYIKQDFTKIGQVGILRMGVHANHPPASMPSVKSPRDNPSTPVAFILFPEMCKTCKMKPPSRTALWSLKTISFSFSLGE